MEIKKRKYSVMRIVLGSLLAAPILYFIFLLVVVGPTDTRRANCQAVSGTVLQIEESGTNDLVFTLEEVPHTFYINRGLEWGLTIDGLKAQLVGAEVKLWHAKSWPFRGGHIAQMMHDEQVIYSEWN